MKALIYFSSNVLSNSEAMIKNGNRLSTSVSAKVRSHVKKINILFFILLLSIATIANAQTTRTVGGGGNYATLKLAFDAINAGTITGAITLQIIANTTETASAVLNSSGSGSANYTSVSIYPTITGLTISGNLGSPLINLNGADNVTIDGRLNATGSAKDLTITNTNTGGSSSTILFINSAENNTVKYCTIKGSEGSNARGIIFFSSATAGNGNDGNTIDNNNITNNAAVRPYYAIYSAGSAGFINSGNTISNNLIYDFFRNANSSYGIYLIANTSAWVISNNSFYETTTFVPTANTTYSAIRINNTSNVNFTITGNYIGGSAALCGGAAWTKTNAFNSTFYGILLNIGTGTVSSVQNNTIRNFAWSNSSSAAWTGIHIAEGAVNLGTVTGNTIGATTGTGSIVVTAGATGANVFGINNSSAGTVDCRNNTIGSITAAASNATFACNFFGIYRNGAGATTISNNTIGSTITANSIQASSGSTANAQSVFGINNVKNGTLTINNNIIDNLINNTVNSTAATAGLINGIKSTSATNTITNNTIRNLSIANANTSSTNTASICGVALTGASLKTVTGNSIYNLSNTYVSFAGSVIGIYFTANTGANTVSRNFIHSLSVTGATSTTATIYGIRVFNGATTFSNNIINLGGNTATTIYGIYETGTSTSNNNNLYFNTIYIGGSLGSGVTNKSYALYSAVSTNRRNFRNNIFANARSTTSGASLHYAVYFNYAVTTNLTLDYNDYYITGTGGVLGYYNSLDLTTLPLITGLDAFSMNINPILTNAGSTAAIDYKPASDKLVGTTISTLPTDYFLTNRAGTPTIGAIEGTLSLNIDVYKAGVFQSTYLRLKDAFDKINNGLHTGALELRIKANTTETVAAILYESGYTGAGGTSNYSSVNIYPTVSGITVSGNLASALIELNGADNVTIDGRVNAAGSSKDLILTNTNTGTSASTIRFINTAETNTVKYCTVKGSETSATRGILWFSTATTGNGNDGNTINNNTITSDAAGRPINAIYSAGSSGFENSGNTISNNSIYDFIRNGTASYGIFLSSFTTAWNITGNSFYETSASFVPTASVEYDAIRINNTLGVNFVVAGNFIGGSSASCGGSAWTKTNNFNNTFYAIYINVGTGTSSSVQNNTIQNIVWSNSGTASLIGINVVAGAVNIGTVTGNTIGAATGNGSITVTGLVTGGYVYGIYIASTGNVDCRNNIIGSITTDNADANLAQNFYGIYKTATAGTTIIRYNSIGSTLTANSIHANSSSISNAQNIVGILSAGTGTTTISDNYVANLTNEYTGAATSSTHGIRTTSGSNTIQNNTIRNIISHSGQGGSNTAASLIGISQTAATGGSTQTITGNSIYDLSNNNATARVDVYGIQYTGPTSGLNSVSGNFIHSLSISSSNIASNIEGIELTAGLTTCYNNIINLGVGITIGYSINGIWDESGASNNNSIYFNSVYIGGSVTSGTTSSTAALRNEANTSTRNYRNNILFNDRTGGLTGKHYAVSLAGITNLTIDYNDYFVTGTNGMLGKIGALDKVDLAALALGTSQDAQSLSIDPGYTVPGGTSPLNYYISSLLPGVSGTGITNDFSGVTRGVTPRMGALEANDYVWQGNISSDFGTSGNWVLNAVPSNGADITFAANPDNHCVLDQDRTIRNIINAQGSDKFVVNGHMLNLTGDLTFSNGAQIDATATSSAIVFEGLVAQNIPSGAFVSNTIDALSINNSSGVFLHGTLTITQTLTLSDGAFAIGSGTLGLNGDIDTTAGTLVGGSSSNLNIGGSGSNISLPALSLNNFTLNRANGANLGGSLSIGGTLALTDGTLTLGANNLTISGNSPTRTSGNIDASNSADTLTFTNASGITLPDAIFMGNVSNLTINAAGGVTSSGDFTVDGILNLQSANPSSTKGSLDMLDGATIKTLNMGADATTIGPGDVTGIVRRSTILPDIIYSFGNQYTTIEFFNVGILPSEISLKIRIGIAPAWKPDAIERIIDLIQTGGNGTQTLLYSHYLDSELNGNDESILVNWVGILPVTAVEYGRSDYNALNNWVSISDADLAFFSSSFGDIEVSLGESQATSLTWNGSFDTSWIDANNWTPNAAPSDNTTVIIPDASTTAHDPSIPLIATCQTLTIHNGGILNSLVGGQLTITGATGAWKNNGGIFYPGNSTIIFSNSDASIIGTTDFNNVTINSGANLAFEASAYMGVAGTLTNNGAIRTIENGASTIDYNGGDQTVIIPDIATNTYSTLILSGSGIKTMPITDLQIAGDLSVEGSARTTLNSSITVGGNLTIANGCKLTLSPISNLTVTGDLTNNAGTSGLVIESTAAGSGSLIHNTAGVRATFQRYMLKDSWHIISTPVSGQSIPAFLTNPANTIPTSGPNYGMMSYSEAGSGWVYFTAATIGNLSVGTGYLLRHTTDAAVSAYGILNDSTIDVNITQTSNGWNGIGNPFPCSIGVREDATTDDNFLTYNAAAFDPSYAVLYLWDEPLVRVPGVVYYKVIGNSGFSSSKPVLDQAYLQPGQGFLIKSKTGGGTISFTEAMRVHENTASFFKAARAPWPGINLVVNSVSKTASTALTFHENMTRGLDVTYDAGLLGGDPAFKLYSRLVEDNGINFMLQCLPDFDFDTMCVPLGIDFNAGGMVTFTTEITSLPSGCKTILEDRLLGTFTDLSDASSSYSINLAPNTSGIGRFYIYTIIDNIPPSIPTGITSSNITGNSFTLTWDASTDNVGVTGYEVFKNAASLGTTTDVSMSISGLTSATAYNMTVKARDAVANWSEASIAIEVTTLDTIAPSAPTGLASSAITGNSFTLFWNAPTDNVEVTGYEVFKDAISLGTTTNLSINISDLASATTYAMTVKARDAADNWSEASTALEVTTLDTIAPNIPSSLTATDLTNNSFTLSWDASIDNVGVTEYEVFKDAFSLGTTADLSMSISGITCETTYDVTVKASDASGNWSEASTSLPVTTLACSDSATSINANAANSISVYPNPAKSKLIFQNVPLNASITAFNVEGELVSSLIVFGSTSKFDVSDWKKGIYLFKIQTSNGVIIKMVSVE